MAALIKFDALMFYVDYVVPRAYSYSVQQTAAAAKSFRAENRASVVTW